MPDGALNPLCWMAAFPGPFILRAGRLLTIQIRGFEMAESRIWKKWKRAATSLAALAPASQGVKDILKLVSYRLGLIDSRTAC